MAFDLNHMQYATFDDLYPYCYRVASIVGLICLKVFGTQDPRAQEYAINLGIAFQLTNILRDVAEDAERGRIYLPEEFLEAEGLKEVSCEEIIRAPRVDRVCRKLGQLAREHFKVANDVLPRSERSSMRPALLMREVYQTYLDRIEALDFRADAPPLRLKGREKLFLVARD